MSSRSWVFFLLFLFSTTLSQLNIDPLADRHDFVDDTLGSADTAFKFDNDQDERIFTYAPWKFDKTAPTFPEDELLGPMTDDHVGVSFSAGGTRAVIASMGQLRGLKRAGLLPHVRYLSTSSSASWTTTLFSYADSSFHEDLLLNLHTEPETLQKGSSSPENLQEGAKWFRYLPSRNIGSLAAEINQDKLLWDEIRNYIDPDHRAWSEALHRLVLKPWKVEGDSDSDFLPFTWSQDYFNTKIVSNNPSFGGQRVASVRGTGDPAAKPPYPIWTAGMVTRVDQPWTIYPLEMSPLGVGVAALHENANPWNGHVGGGWVPPFAFNAYKVQRGSFTVKVLRAENLCSTLTPDPWTRLEFQGQRQSTDKFGNEQNPTWDQEFTFLVEAGISPDVRLNVKVLDADLLDTDTLGEHEIDMRTIPFGTVTSRELLLDAGCNSKLYIELNWTSFQTFTDPSDQSKIQPRSVARQFSLRDAVGASSSHLAVRVNADQDSLFHWKTPIFTYFPAQHLDQPKNIPATYHFVDGANIDPLGIMPLLLRKVKKIIAFVNTYDALEVDGDQIIIAESVAALWGYQRKPRGQPWRTFAEELYTMDVQAFRHNQVFNDTNQWDELKRSLLEDKDAGRPCFFKQTLQVQDNPFWGITPYQVEIVWAYNELNMKWRERLSPDALQEVKGFARFPHFQIIEDLELRDSGVNLFASMVSTGIVDTQHNEELMALFPNVVVTPPQTASPPIPIVDDAAHILVPSTILFAALPFLLF